MRKKQVRPPRRQRLLQRRVMRWRAEARGSAVAGATPRAWSARRPVPVVTTAQPAKEAGPACRRALPQPAASRMSLALAPGFHVSCRSGARRCPARPPPRRRPSPGAHPRKAPLRRQHRVRRRQFSPCSRPGARRMFGIPQSPPLTRRLVRDDRYFGAASRRSLALAPGFHVLCRLAGPFIRGTLSPPAAALAGSAPQKSAAPPSAPRPSKAVQPVLPPRRSQDVRDPSVAAAAAAARSV
jgi:hypothetical protein